MTCPNCGGRPLTRAGFLLKPQIFSLACRHCLASLRMPRSLKILMVCWFGLTIVTVRYVAKLMGPAAGGIFTLQGACRYLITILLPACLMALVFRALIFRCAYLPDETPSVIETPAGDAEPTGEAMRRPL